MIDDIVYSGEDNVGWGKRVVGGKLDFTMIKTFSINWISRPSHSKVPFKEVVLNTPLVMICNRRGGGTSSGKAAMATRLSSFELHPSWISSNSFLSLFIAAKINGIIINTYGLAGRDTWTAKRCHGDDDGAGSDRATDPLKKAPFKI